MLKINEGLRAIIGVCIIVGVITFAATSGFWMSIITSGGHSDVMIRCAIESLDIANDFALQGDWSNASKFLDISTGYTWRAAWENDIRTKPAWNNHILELHIDMAALCIALQHPYFTYRNETYLNTFGINETYTITVENVTGVINKTIGELLPYSDIDPARHPEYGGHISNLQIWEKYKEHYKDKPSSGGGFKVIT